MGCIGKYTCDACGFERLEHSFPDQWNYAYVYLNYWERPKFLLCYECSRNIRHYSFFKATLIKLGILK